MTEQSIDMLPSGYAYVCVYGLGGDVLYISYSLRLPMCLLLYMPVCMNACLCVKGVGVWECVRVCELSH